MDHTLSNPTTKTTTSFSIRADIISACPPLPPRSRTTSLRMSRPFAKIHYNRWHKYRKKIHRGRWHKLFSPIYSVRWHKSAVRRRDAPPACQFCNQRSHRPILGIPTSCLETEQKNLDQHFIQQHKPSHARHWHSHANWHKHCFLRP